MNKKKTIILAVAGLLAGGAFGGAMINSQGGIANVFANDNAEAVVWKHYAAVAPTFTSHGSKEFWANCSSLGVHQFEAPTKGTIEEGGDFSATTYFKELTEDDDRYIAKLTPKVSFDSRGGTAIESQDVEYETLATEPTAPTREADDYYDSYTFDGWYTNGEKFDFTKPVTGNVDLVAKWKYGNKKYSYVVDSWKAADFTTGDKAVMQNINGATSQMAYANGAVDQAKKQQYITEFGKTDEEGIFFNPNGTTGTTQIPAINFSSILENHNKVYMTVGGFQSNNSLFINAGGDEAKVKISWNGGENSIAQLTRTRLSFTKDAEGKVHLFFEDMSIDKPFETYDNRIRSGDVILSDKQANGEEGLIFSTQQAGSRHYWLEKPYMFEDQETILDVSTKSGLSVSEGTIYTQEEANKLTNSAPYGQWYNPVLLNYDGVGILGQSQKSSELSFDPMDFSSLFASGKGVKFTIGGWNGLETIYYKNAGENIELGKNEERPNAEGVSFHDPFSDTRDNLEKTWKNWEVTIDPVGVSVHNKNTNMDYVFALTSDQLNGTASIKFDLSQRSNAHFFLISNWQTYHL